MIAWMHHVPEESWRHLAMALLHTLWQGAIVGVLLYALLRNVSARRTTLRYSAALIALFVIVLGGFSTWAILQHKPGHGPLTDTHAPIDALTIERGSDEASPSGIHPIEPVSTVSARPIDWAKWVAIVWLIGAGVMLIRAGLSVLDAQSLRRRCVRLSDGPIVELVEDLRRQLGMSRRVLVAIGDHIAGPCVLGVVWPTILLPASIVSGVPIESIRMILAHEIAHVRRWDYLVNLIQLLIESLLFFNPAVWWVSRQIRIEREACCDAAAVCATRETIGYVEALSDWVQRLRDLSMAPAPVMALDGGERPSSSLLDRISRLVVPGYRPTIRLSWTRLAVALVVGLAMLAGLWRGTEAAVAIAADILSPQQRIEKIEEARKTLVPLQALDDAGRESQANRGVVRGKIVTPDGKAPKKLSVMGNYRSGNTSGSASARDDKPEYEISFPPGIAFIEASAEGYAPTIVGPLVIHPKEKLENVNIALDVGISAKLQLQDADGKPIGVNADVQGGVPIDASYSLRDWTTDDTGLLTIPHATTRPYNMTVRAPGIEETRREGIVFKPGEVVAWKLKAAKPATGTLVRYTGEPVAGATLRIFGETDSDSTTRMSAWHGRVVGKTDDAGRYTINSLRQGTTYRILAETREDGPHFIDDVRAGQEDRRAEIGPPLSIHGTITGDLSLLNKGTSGPVIAYSMDVTMGDHSYGGSNTAIPVTVNGGVGEFTIPNLVPSKVHIYAGKQRKLVELSTTSVKDLRIELKKDAESVAERKVVLRFATEAGAAAPRGTVDVQQYRADGTYMSGSMIEIKDGQVVTSAPVGGRLLYRPAQVIGYWFKEEDLQKIAASADPLLIDVATVPAGAIGGRIMNADGSITGSPPTAHVEVIRKAEGLPPHFSIDSNRLRVDSSTGGFLVTPLPLGGAYRLKFVADRTFVISEIITLSAADPIKNVELKIPKGVEATVLVQDPAGKPVAGVAVDFAYEADNGSHGFSPSPKTDEQGIVRYKAINPDVPGTYSVTIASRKDYRPARAKLALDGSTTTIRLEKGETLEGVMIDAKTGWPVPDADIRAIPRPWIPGDVGNYQAEAKTDISGRFRFSNLGSGDYSIIPQEANPADATKPNIGKAGSTEKIELRVVLPAWSKLKPTPPVG